MHLKFTFTYLFVSICLLAWCTAPSYAGWWDSPAARSQMGTATGNNAIINSPYYNPSLPTSGLNPYAYNPAVPYEVPIGNGFYSIKYGGTLMRFWRAPSGYYYPWASGGYSYGYNYPIVYQSGQAVQASPSVTTVFNDMQNYLDESKAKDRLSENDYDHLDRRLHDLIGKSEEINGEGNSPDQDPDLQQDVKDLGLDIAHRIKPSS